MIQDIAPHKFHPEYTPRVPNGKDYVLLYDRDKIWINKPNGKTTLPTHSALKEKYPQIDEGLLYLFTVDDIAFYLGDPTPLQEDPKADPALEKEPIFQFREMDPLWLGFAGATGNHLYEWYRAHRFCGCCGHKMGHSETERALVCPACDYVVYPSISPVVMVAVVDGDNLLVTQYAHRAYKKYAMIAGYVEIGETLEDAARREVLEEVGLHVKNLRYFKSQPWAFSGTILSGFFAELDGSPKITVDETELSDAIWLNRANVPTDPAVDLSGVSLSSELMRAFYEKENLF